jgi:hypothetical protein
VFKTVAKTVSYKSVSSESVEQVAQRQSTKKLVTKQYSFELEQSIAHNSAESIAQENPIEQQLFQNHIISLFN